MLSHSTKKKAIFIHVAKAAGSSINKYFSEHLGDKAITHCEGVWADLDHNSTEFDFISGHVGYPRMLERFGNEHYYFAFLRNPVHHLYSHLNWVRDLARPENRDRYLNHPVAVQRIADKLITYNITEASQVEAFLSQMNVGERGLFDNCQTRYFTPYTPEMLTQAHAEDALRAIQKLDFVGTVDRQHESLCYLARSLNLPVPENQIRVNINKKSSEGINNLPPKTIEVYKQYVRWDASLYSTIKTTLDAKLDILKH